MFYIAYTSFCPTIGGLPNTRRSAPCPSITPAFTRSHLNVSYIGFSPYIEHGSPLGGTDVEVLGMLARKHGFSYSFTPERSYDWVKKKDDTSIGAVYRVRNQSV